jgi:hypothetical protein
MSDTERSDFTEEELNRLRSRTFNDGLKGLIGKINRPAGPMDPPSIPVPTDDLMRALHALFYRAQSLEYPGGEVPGRGALPEQAGGWIFCYESESGFYASLDGSRRLLLTAEKFKALHAGPRSIQIGPADGENSATLTSMARHPAFISSLQPSSLLRLFPVLYNQAVIGPGCESALYTAAAECFQRACCGATTIDDALIADLLNYYERNLLVRVNGITREELIPLHRRFSALIAEEFPGIACITSGPGEMLILCFEEQYSGIVTRVRSEDWFGSLIPDVSFKDLFSAI